MAGTKAEFDAISAAFDQSDTVSNEVEAAITEVNSDVLDLLRQASEAVTLEQAQALAARAAAKVQSQSAQLDRLKAVGTLHVREDEGNPPPPPEPPVE